MERKLFLCFFLTLISCLWVCQAQKKLDLKNKKATQGATIGSHEASLAIDEDVKTYALSSSPLVTENMAWWNLELVVDYFYHSVAVTSPQHFGGVYTDLEFFEVMVFTFEIKTQSCYRFTGRFMPGERKHFVCVEGPLFGDTIYIRKLTGGMSNNLALAEVEVYVV